MSPPIRLAGRAVARFSPAIPLRSVPVVDVREAFILGLVIGGGLMWFLAYYAVVWLVLPGRLARCRRPRDAARPAGTRTTGPRAARPDGRARVVH